MLTLTKFPSFHSSHQQYTTVKLRLPNTNWSAQHIVNKTHRAKARFLSSKCGIFPNFISSLKMDMYVLSPDPLDLSIPTIIREPFLGALIFLCCCSSLLFFSDEFHCGIFIHNCCTLFSFRAFPHGSSTALRQDMFPGLLHAVHCAVPLREQYWS